MRSRAFFAVLLVVAGTLLSLPLSMHAQEGRTSQLVTMTWSFRNSHPNTVYLQLYAQYKKGHVWPGPGKYYKLDDSAAHTAKIQCWEGEKICYGAWTSGGAEWGVGRDDKRSCKGCCVTCSAGDHGTRNLTQ